MNSLERMVEFFNVFYKVNEMYSLSTTSELIHKSLIKLLTQSIQEKEYMLKMYKGDKNPTIVIQLTEIKDTFIFGILGKLDDLSNKSLIRIRGKSKEDIHRTSSVEDLNYYIENFTYFYIRLDDLCCAVLKNNSAPSFKKYFSMLIAEKVNYRKKFFDAVCILPRIESNIHDKISRFKNIAEINLAFYNNDCSPVNQMLSLEEIFDISQSSIELANINIILDPKVNKNKLKEKLVSSTAYYDFSKFKVTGIGEHDVTECVDILERLLTRKVLIDIEEEYLMSSDNEEKIKQALISVLPIT